MNIHLIIKQLPLSKTNHVKAVVSAIAAKAIPVVVLLAMSPVNATPHEALAQLSEKNSVTMYSQLPQIEAPNALEVAQNPEKPQITQKDIAFLNTIFDDPRGHYIAWDKFRGDDNKYHFLVLYASKNAKNDIKKIFIIPEDYKIYKDETGYNWDHPADVFRFIYHEEVNGNDDFLGVALWSSKDDKSPTTMWEMRLPDEIGDKLADLLLGKTPYKYVGDAQLEFTQSRELKTKFY